ncbi:MAG: hypothetical protein RL662_1643, partial [Bacteroidota bacterium]
ILNNEAIENYLDAFGFESVDTEGMTLLEQIQLFSNSKVVIGIHGAGLANIIYRFGRPLHVIEIFPSNFIPDHYKIISELLDYSYTRVIGGPLEDKVFYLDILAFEGIIENL